MRSGKQHRHWPTTAARRLEAGLTACRNVERVNVAADSGATFRRHIQPMFRHHRQRPTATGTGGGFGGDDALPTARCSRSSDATVKDLLPPDTGDRWQQQRMTDEQQCHYGAKLCRVGERSTKNRSPADTDQRQKRKRKHEDAAGGEEAGNVLGGAELELKNSCGIVSMSAAVVVDCWDQPRLGAKCY